MRKFRYVDGSEKVAMLSYEFYDVLNKIVIVWCYVLREEGRKPGVDRCGRDLYFWCSCSPDCTFCIRI